MGQEVKIPVTQKQLDASDFAAMHAAVDEGHLTHGRHADEFERALAQQFGLRCCSYVNSGSSANLLALAALMDESLGDARLRPGDEVVTCAAGFPTTVNPIVQLGMVPVFVDCLLPTYGPNMEQVTEAIKRPKVRGLIFAHTLGNPVDSTKVHLDPSIASKRAWWVEDCCDALGSTYMDKHVGTFGEIATCSFYPAHHITTGEGGAVLTDSPKLDSIVRSLRDWGRDCWCPTGKDNTCGKRFDWEHGCDRCDGYGRVACKDKFLSGVGDSWEVCPKCNGKSSRLPDGYDHKHVFSRIGYNLKGTDIGAALGVSQLKRLPQFEAARKRNFKQLYSILRPHYNQIVLPQETPGSDPSWFGFPITLADHHDRRKVVAQLEAAGVATRPIFAGNLVRQPAYAKVKYEVVGDLSCADRVMRQSFYVGCHAGLGEEHMDYLGQQIRKAVTNV